MQEKIKIAGFGGQGVVLAANVLAQAAVFEGKNVAAMVSYGVEMRGGTANSTLIISDEEIASPVIDTPNSVIILNQPSLDKFEDKVERNGWLILNESLVKRDVKRKDVRVVKIKATDAANELGNMKVANLVLLGAFIKKTKIVDLDTAIKILPKAFPKHKENLVEINKKALLRGARLCL